MPKPNLRTKLLIYPRFQLLLIGINSLLTICAFTITILEVSHEFSRFHQLGESIKLAPEHAFFRMIQMQQNSLTLCLITAFLITIVLSAVLTLVISHRLSGPIVRMRNFLKEVSRSPNSGAKLTFRKGDFFDDLPEVVNDALTAVGKK